MNPIVEFLESSGPCLSSQIADWLVRNKGISSEAARKRLSRAIPPVRSYPVPLFPKRTRFMYLQHQRASERFYEALLRDLRTTNSVYGLALDGMLARDGAVRPQDFATISGAPAGRLKGQVMASSVQKRLADAALIREEIIGGETVLAISQPALGVSDPSGLKARDTAEKIILDGLREWARRTGAASYNQIRIRGEQELKAVGQFNFDLAGPSFLLPLRKPKGTGQGFLVADVFSHGILDEYHIGYFIRKATTLKSSGAGVLVLPVLVAEGFTGKALTTGHAAGLMMATPTVLFGSRVGEGITSLVETLTRAAAYASSDTPDRILSLVSRLSEIEGRAGNLRGTMFELLCAYLVRRDAVSINMGVTATHPNSGERADIDVLKYVAQGADCIAIECKAKEPGGVVVAEEVGRWLKKVSVIRAYLQHRNRLEHGAKVGFEIWTTGSFSPDALELLQKEASMRTKAPIAWKNGKAVLDMAATAKEKAVADALDQHFIKHPLAQL